LDFPDEERFFLKLKKVLILDGVKKIILYCITFLGFL